MCPGVCPSFGARSGFHFSKRLTGAVTPLRPPGRQCLDRTVGWEWSSSSGDLICWQKKGVLCLCFYCFGNPNRYQSIVLYYFGSFPF